MDLLGVVGPAVDRGISVNTEFMRDEEARSRALFVLMMLDLKKIIPEPMKVDYNLYYRSRKCEVFKELLRQGGVEIYENTEGYLRDRGSVYRVRFIPYA